MRGDGRGRDPRIALVCIGIGRFQRGFERYFSDLFDHLRDQLDVTLFRGAGAGPGERTPRALPMLARIARALPLGSIGTEYPYYRHDCAAYALAMAPDLLRGGFDVVHTIDPPLARALQYLQLVSRFRARLVWTNGCRWPPSLYPRNTHIHHVARELYDAALDDGVDPARITYAPCAVDCGKFVASADRRTLRAKHGLPEDGFVVAAVSAVKRAHKRVDHVIEEVAAMRSSAFLWIDGKAEDPEIPRLAAARLGARCKVTCLPSSEVADVYHAADVLAHGALDESFGLAVVEAMSTGLRVLVHDTPHFAWLTRDPQCLVDMTAPGALAARLDVLAAQPERRDVGGWGESVRRRFDWSVVRDRYVHMYHRLAAASVRDMTSAGEDPRSER